MSVEHLGQYDSGISYKKVIFWFILAATIISALALYFVLSKATIYLIPKTESKELDLEVTITPDVENINFEKNTIRGVLLAEESEVQKSFEDIPPKKLEENATGEVTVHNGYTRAQGFKEGDILVTAEGGTPQKAVVTESTIVYRDQTKTIKVAAQEKGIAGHIPPSRFHFEKYDEFMNEQVTAQSIESFSGGVRTATLITEEDIAVAQSDLEKMAFEENLKKLQEKLRPGEEISDENTVNNILSFHSSVTPPVEINHFEASMILRTTAAVFKKEDLVALINNKLQELTGKNQEFLQYNADSLSYSLEKITSEQNKAILRVKIAGKFRPKLSTQLFNKDEIKGYNERAVRAHYADFEDIEGIEVKFWPAFRKTIPDMDSRIIIEVKN